jgi:hypothetical protein
VKAELTETTRINVLFDFSIFSDSQQDVVAVFPILTTGKICVLQTVTFSVIPSAKNITLICNAKMTRNKTRTFFGKMFKEINKTK